MRNLFQRVSESRPGPRQYADPWPSSRLALALKYAIPHLIQTIFFVPCIPIVSRVGAILCAKSLFSRTSVVKFDVC